MTALLDTGFLLAVLDADDEFHKVCTEVLLNEPQPLLPDQVERNQHLLRDFIPPW